MVILHIARKGDNPCNGVSVAMPGHVRAQQKQETVGLLNIVDAKFDGIDNQFVLDGKFSLEKLPQPFNKPDLVVFHEVYRVEYLKIYKVLKKRGVPYVILPHGGLTVGAQNNKKLKKKVANILLFNRFIKGAVAIQCLSQKELNETKFKVNKFIGTNGIDIPKVQKQEFSADGLKFLFIGRLDMYHKGLDILLEAVGSIKDFLAENNCKFYIYGPDSNGGYEQIKQAIAQNGLKEIIILNREIVGQNKADELLSADCFIQTSRFEGMPMGILEAMGYGLPCLVTYGTVLGEFISEHDAGWACATDAESVAAAIKQAVGQKNTLSEKSKNAVKAVKENFGWESVAKHALEKYGKLINKID